MTKGAGKRGWPIYAGLVISALLLAVVIYQVDRIELAATIGRVGALPLLWAAVGYLAAFAAVADRFARAVGRLAVRPPSISEVARTYLPLILATSLLGHALSVGAEVARLVFLRRRHGITLQLGLSLVIVDRVVGVAGSAALATVSVILVFWPMPMAVRLAVLAATLAIGVVVLLQRDRLLSLLSRLPSVHAIVNVYVGRTGLVVEQLVLALAANSGLALAIWVLSRAINSDIPAAIAFAAAPIIYVGSSVPFTYAGWGSREIACLAALAFTGWMSTVDALALSVALGLAAFLASVPGLINIRESLNPGAPSER